MRESPKRHVLAVLRLAIGLSQKEMAELLGCSTRAVQSIELGQLKLSEKLAEKTALQTGASIEWLMKNDVSIPPTDSLGKPITRDSFIETQSAIKRPHDAKSDVHRIMEAHVFAVEAAQAILLRALQQNRVDLYVYKLLTSLGELAEELGEEPCLDSFIFNLREKDKNPSPDDHEGVSEALVDFFYDYCRKFEKDQKKSKPLPPSAKK